MHIFQPSKKKKENTATPSLDILNATQSEIPLITVQWREGFFFFNFLHLIWVFDKYYRQTECCRINLDSSSIKGCVVLHQRLPFSDSCFVLLPSDFLVNTSKVYLCTRSAEKTVQIGRGFTFNSSLHLRHTHRGRQSCSAKCQKVLSGSPWSALKCSTWGNYHLKTQIGQSIHLLSKISFLLS